MPKSKAKEAVEKETTKEGLPKRPSPSSATRRSLRPGSSPITPKPSCGL